MGAKTEKLWFTRVEAAELTGVGERQFDAAIRPRMGAEGIRGRGKSLRFKGAAVVAAVVDYRIEQAKPADPEEALLSGPNTPAMERLRLAKAKLAEMDLAERETVLIRFNVIKNAMRPAVAAMRSTGDRLVRLFGNEAGEIFNEGVSEFEAAASRMIGQQDAGGGNGIDSESGGVDEDAPATDDWRVLRSRDHPA